MFGSKLQNRFQGNLTVLPWMRFDLNLNLPLEKVFLGFVAMEIAPSNPYSLAELLAA